MNILKLYKSHKLIDIIGNKTNDRKVYIIRMMLDSDYYYYKVKLEQLQEVLIYLQNFKFETRKQDIVMIEEIIKNNKMEFVNYLKDYEVSKKMNQRKNIINIFINL